MYRLLIVDDEVHAVEAVKSGADWESLSIGPVLSAYNIAQAQQAMLDDSIDIMICDIELSQENGLDLVSWVTQHSQHTVSILLTCHSSFHYAKRALQLGSLDYLLKPVLAPELKEALLKAIELIDERRERNALTDKYFKYHHLWQAYRPLLVERYWEVVLSGSAAPLREPLPGEDAALPCRSKDRFVPIYISIQRWYKEFGETDQGLLMYAVRNAAEGVVRQAVPEVQLVSAPQGIIAILPDRESGLTKDKLRQMLTAYIDWCNQYLYCDLSCYAGRSCALVELAEEVKRLQQLEKRNVTQNNKLFFIDEAGVYDKTLELIDMSQWLELLKQDAYEAVMREIVDYLNEWRKVDWLDTNMLQEFLDNLLQMINHVIQIKGKQSHSILAELIRPDRLSEAVASVTELQAWTRNVMQKVVSALSSSGTMESVVDKTKWYVKQHLDERLGREELANQVHLHPDYLSRIFRKETGISLYDYIFEERMKLAQSMLAKTDLSVSGIAISVGYSNFSYFSKMFKKLTKYSPQEYRELHR